MIILLEKDDYIYIGDRQGILPIEKSKLHNTLVQSRIDRIDVAQVDGNTKCCKVSTLLKKDGSLSRKCGEPLVVKKNSNVYNLQEVGSMTLNGSWSGKIQAYGVCIKSPGGKEGFQNRVVLWFSNWDECIVLDNPNGLKSIECLLSGENSSVFYLGRNVYENMSYWYPMFLNDKKKIMYIPHDRAGYLMIGLIENLVRKGKVKVKTYCTTTRSLKNDRKSEGTMSWVCDEVGDALLEMLYISNKVKTRYRTRLVNGVLEIYQYTDYDRSAIQSKSVVPLDRLIL